MHGFDIITILVRLARVTNRLPARANVFNPAQGLREIAFGVIDWTSKQPAAGREKAVNDKASACSLPRGAIQTSSFPRSRTRNTFLHAKDPGCSHSCAGDFLDFAGRAGAVVHLNALTQPQIGDVPLPRHLIGHRRRCKRAQHKAAEQRERKTPDVREGFHDRRDGLRCLSCILPPDQSRVTRPTRDQYQYDG